jgi:Ca2+-binding RTX toxin-like protein
VVSLVLEQYRTPEVDPPQGQNDDNGCGQPDDNWSEVNRYFNQSSLYLQAGEAVHTNNPAPGQWRICIAGDIVTNAGASLGFDLDIDFTTEEGFHLPPGGQAPYNVSNMDFFEDLQGSMNPGQLTGVTADSILSGATNLDQFSTLVVADNPFPGYVEQAKTGPAQTDPNSPYSNPGLGTSPCAYQRGTTDVPPGSNNPTPGCAAEIPLTIDPAANNQRWVVSLDTSQEGTNDWDLYVDVQDPDSGNWIEAGRSAGGTGDETVTLLTPPPGDYRILVVNWSGTASSFPQTLTVTFDNAPVGPPPPPSSRSPADVANWKTKLLAFVQNGGNLVLTDGALLNLDLLDLVDRSAISEFSVYAGYIGFTADGGTTDTYGDPLAANVNQPGAAEGPGHRHQTYEPVPIGFAIQDESGADFNSAPVWAVKQNAWEAAGGRTAGTTGPTQVTLGELALGQGRVRIIGPLLPMPTEQYYHPFGLASHALTYSGYQVFNNALQWNRPPAAGAAGAVAIPKDCSRLKRLSGYNIVIGTQGKDTIVGTSGKDGLCGRKGKDKVRGLGDKDVLIGGKGNDKVVGAGGNDGLFAGAGNDRLSGGAGKDRLVGHQGNDRLAGGGGRDTHRSGKGKDACRGGPGKDKYQGCEQQA